MEAGESSRHGNSADSSFLRGRAQCLGWNASYPGRVPGNGWGNKPAGCGRKRGPRRQAYLGENPGCTTSWNIYSLWLWISSLASVILGSPSLKTKIASFFYGSVKSHKTNLGEGLHTVFPPHLPQPELIHFFLMNGTLKTSDCQWVWKKEVKCHLFLFPSNLFSSVSQKENLFPHI